MSKKDELFVPDNESISSSVDLCFSQGVNGVRLSSI